MVVNTKGGQGNNPPPTKDNTMTLNAIKTAYLANIRSNLRNRSELVWYIQTLIDSEQAGADVAAMGADAAADAIA
jgi:hypothetical protein